jgi:uncharacterized protein YjbI with pentapeptide repeats
MTKYWTVFVTASLATLLALFAPALVARADIFQWEYINPANPSLGKQQSTMLAPDGAGASAVPAANLPNRNLTMAYLIGADLSAIPIYDGVFELGYVIVSYDSADLHGANLSQADLTNANLTYALLTNANLSGAEVRGATFSLTTFYGCGSGLTPAQLYSTASYQADDLTGIKLEENNLAGVNLAGKNLTNARFFNAKLTGANLSHANLTNVFFSAATLTGANLTAAEVRGADFTNSRGDGITAAQLYSTASYLAHDLIGIHLDANVFSGVNLAGQNLTNASFHFATLTGANFHQANLTNAAFSYGGTTLTNANFSQANLSNANFSYAVLTGANLIGAEVRGADFYRNTDYGTGITAAQLYSTASYQAHDLTGIKLGDNNLAGVNLADQNLSNANFLYATLTGANLSQANLTNARFFNATLTNANLTGADARGAQDFLASTPNSSNLIQFDGHITGLDLTAGASLVVRDYDGNPTLSAPTGPLPIIVDQHLAMDATGALRLVFDANHWDSTISFAPGIPVARGGTLELAFAPDVNVASQIGRTIDLFDWTGVSPTGVFNVSSSYMWDLSKLYTNGEVTLAAVPGIVPGDFNSDGKVDAADYIVWRKNGSTQAAYDTWRTHFGETAGSGAGLPSAEPLSAVPEPSTLLLLILAAASFCPWGRRNS